MRPPLAIIFDFDGVIINSEQVKFKRLGLLLKSHGLRLSKDSFTQMVGKKTSAFLDSKFDKVLTPKQIRAIVSVRRKDQLRNLKAYCKPVPGAISFIRLLKKRRVSLCLATGTSRIIVQKALRLLGLARRFNKVVTGEEFASSKPNPEIYKIAVRKLGVPAKNIFVIEDSAAGIAAAKRAGLYCIAISTTQNKSALRHADVVVDSFKDIRQLLGSHWKG